MINIIVDISGNIGGGNYSCINEIEFYDTKNNYINYINN